MEKHRKQYTSEFKVKVVLESLQRDTTLEEVRTKFGVTNSMIHRWRQEFQAKAADIFVDKRNPKQKAQAQGYAPGESPDDLKRLIGELTVQNEILKKVPGLLGR
jgi:transposase